MVNWLTDPSASAVDVTRASLFLQVVIGEDRRLESWPVLRTVLVPGSFRSSLVQQMERHADNARVQASALHFLREYVEWKPDVDENFCAAVWTCACTALAHCVQDDAVASVALDLMDSYKISRNSAHAFGLDAVVAAMRAHASAAVQRVAWKIICRIIEDAEIRVRAVEAGLIQASVAALRKKRGEVYACFFLRTITDDYLDNQATAASAGAIEAVLYAIGFSDNKDQLRLEGCLALCNMTTSAENLEIARRAGAIQIIQTVIDRGFRQGIIDFRRWDPQTGQWHDTTLLKNLRTLLDRLKL